MSIVSLLVIYSATYAGENIWENFFVSRQFLFFTIGFLVYFTLMMIDISWLKQPSVVLVINIIMLTLLIGVTFLGPVVQETRRWLLIGPFSLQPAEFAKIAILLTTPAIFSWRHEHIFHENKLEFDQARSVPMSIIMSTLIAGIYAGLIFLQPALGNSIIFMTIWLSQILLISPVKFRQLTTIAFGFISLMAYYQWGIFEWLARLSYLNQNLWRGFVLIVSIATALLFIWRFKYKWLPVVAVLLVVIIVSPLLDWGYSNVLRPYHRARVESFVDGFNTDPLDSDFQVRQSLSLFGSGGLFGEGYLASFRSSSGQIPFAHTDFVFAHFGYQFGYIGVLLLFALVGVLLWRISQIYLQSNNYHSKLIVAGVITLFFIHILVNSAMNIGMIPVTGIPFPFISYGGSAVLLMFICLGLMQTIYISEATQKSVFKLS